MDSGVLIVEVVRGGRVESHHRVHCVVSDSTGRIVDSWGDPEYPTQPRSSVKPIQAVPLITSGAADEAGLTDVELALACASHNGEAGHSEAVEAWLGAVGATVDDLECGAHQPLFRPAADALVAAGLPHTRAHNNCSGKHAGFIHTMVHLDERIDGYAEPSHPLQVRATRSLTSFTGVDPTAQVPGIDGCGIPVWSFPLASLARGWARLQAGGVDPDADVAAHRLLDAMMRQPWYVAGTGRHCTKVMQMGRGRIAAKTGAEGVFCAVDRETAIGVALKVEDGASRASEVALDWILAQMTGRGEPSPVPVTNWSGTRVGEIRVRSPQSHSF
ncbi:MAG: asparaginase [Actinomycetia bacterium]|nr:asparaginase [Actinomycetes bacterium]MCP4963567.1 asparaginase [Actinomycetes bacterium]